MTPVVNIRTLADSQRTIPQHNYPTQWGSFAGHENVKELGSAEEGRHDKKYPTQKER
jgi:hypothetical protein